MNLEPVLHSLVWKMFLYVHQMHPGQDYAKSLSEVEVFNGSIFAHCQNFDDYDRAFTIMIDQGLLSRIPFPKEARRNWLEREFVFYELRLTAETLSKHLSSIGVAEGTNEGELIGCFLSLSDVPHGRHRESKPPPMPLGTNSSSLPDCYRNVAKAMANGGYCIVSDRRIAWLPKIAPIMEAEGLWANGKPISALRHEAVVRLWETMPDALKASAKDIYGRVNPLSFYQFIRMHWHPELGWNENEDYRYAGVPRWQGNYRDLAAACERGLS